MKGCLSITIFCLFLGVFIILLWGSCGEKTKNDHQQGQGVGGGYSQKDIEHALEAIKKLENKQVLEIEISDASDLAKIAKNASIVLLPINSEMKNGGGENTEGYTTGSEKEKVGSHEADRYPYDNYAFPNYPPVTLKALYESGVPIRSITTSWPPDLYNRYYFWYPGFYTSGWSFWLRPMRRYGPQGYWLKTNGSYYYIRN